MMDLAQFRREMESFRSDAQMEGQRSKDSQIAMQRLGDLYKRFDEDERRLADQVICEWLLSGDESHRFDARVLVDDFRIQSALPTLQELATRLLLSQAPGAPYELRRVHEIIRRLMH